jgi:hypothetical protein
MKTPGPGKILECLVAACVILAALTAAPYIVLHSGHDCSGDGRCAVCMRLQQAADILGQTHTCAFRPLPPAGFFAAAVAGIRAAFAVPASAVALKVRMNT